MAEFPTGVVTFLFSDIEGSTQLLQRLGEGYAPVLETHRRLFRAVCKAHNGQEIDATGDSFCIVFKAAIDAVIAATALQRALHEHNWPFEGKVRVRIGLHSGKPAHTAAGYIGLDVHVAARVMAAARGGQVLLTQATRHLVGTHWPQGVKLRDLGEHRLKDLRHPQRLCQLIIEGVPSTFPPLATINNRPYNLPTPPTPLIGREQTLKDACALLRRADVRLVTFIAPGGAGKTRLSLQVGSELLADCEDGVFWVALAPLSDSIAVTIAIARSLEISEVAGLSVLESVQEHLRDKRLLLVLDNFEQVLVAAPQVAELLAACPLLKILITSRAPLHLRGEHKFAVPPLELPNLASSLFPQTLAQNAAVQLFVQRAHAVQPDFAITHETLSAIAEICIRLDGLPLAIELAAARVRLFSATTLLNRLKKRLPLLTGGAQDLPERHQTLRNAIAWSYDLLRPDEQKLFRRMAIFSNGCTLEAAENIAILTDEAAFALDEFEALLDHSLLHTRSAADGETRFSMLETIREYALEALTKSGEREVVARRHAEFFVNLAQEAAPLLAGAQQVVWLARLDADHDNLLAALNWLADNEPETGLRLAVLLWPYWLRRGRFAGGRRRLERNLEQTLAQNREVPTALLAQAQLGIGRLAWFQADYAASHEALSQSLALYRQLDDRKGIATALYGLGFVAASRGEHAPSRALLEESLTLKQELGDNTDLHYILTGLVIMASSEQHLMEVRALLESGLTTARREGNPRGIGLLLFNLGITAYFQDDYAAAQEALNESLKILHALGDTWAVARVMWGLGSVSCALGEHAPAQSFFNEALTIHTELRGHWEMCQVIEFIAFLAAEQAQPARAVTLLSAAAALRETLHYHQVPVVLERYERYLNSLQTTMDDAAFEAAWSAGQAMSLKEAVAFASSSTVEDALAP